MSTLFKRINGHYGENDNSLPGDVGRLVVSLNEVTVFTKENGWLFQTPHRNDTCVICDRHYHEIQLLRPAQWNVEHLTRFLLRTAFECRFCYEGIVSLHAACVEMGDFAVAFTGHSGLGKSTRAKAWVDGLGARWISGDRPAVRLEKTGSTACGVPWDGKEQIFRDVEVPLKCIMEVRRSLANYVRRLSEDQARRLIMQQSFVPMWDTDAAVMAMANVRQLVRKTPVYRVFCGPEAEDAKAIYDILVNHPELIREEAKDMKIKEGFVLRNVVDEFIVMPTGDNIAKFEGAVVLNEVSAFIFKQLETPVSHDDLLAAMLSEYDVDEATARTHVAAFIEKLKSHDFLQ